MYFFKKYWIGICSVLAIGISGFFLYVSFVGFYFNPSGGVAETAGRSFTYTWIAFFVATSLRKRWRRKKLEFWIFCFAASFSLCSIYDSLIATKKVSQLNNAKQELARLANDVEKPSSQQAVNEYSSEQYGDFSKLIPLIKNSFIFFDKMEVEINAACSELENILTPAYLCEKEHIIQAKMRVASFSTKMSHFEQEYEKEVSITQQKFKEAFSGNENLKRLVLQGFEKGRKISSKLMKEYFNIEKECAQKIENILNFLSTKSVTFSESEGFLIFENDEDVDIFNQLVQDLTDHFQKEDLINEKLENHRQSFLQKMKDFD